MIHISSFKGKLTHQQDELYIQVVLGDLKDMSFKSFARDSKYLSS